MTLRIATNGSGRIGRIVLRALVQRADWSVDVTAIDDLAPPAHIAHLPSQGSRHGRTGVLVRGEQDTLHTGDCSIRLTAIRNPGNLPGQDVDIALGGEGLLADRDAAARHRAMGAGPVLISAPGGNADRTVVDGAKHFRLTLDNANVQAAGGDLMQDLTCSDTPLVSADFNHDPHSSRFAAARTAVMPECMTRGVGGMGKKPGLSKRKPDLWLCIGACPQHPLQMAS